MSPEPPTSDRLQHLLLTSSRSAASAFSVICILLVFAWRPYSQRYRTQPFVVHTNLGVRIHKTRIITTGNLNLDKQRHTTMYCATFPSQRNFSSHFISLLSSLSNPLLQLHFILVRNCHEVIKAAAADRRAVHIYRISMWIQLSLSQSYIFETSTWVFAKTASGVCVAATFDHSPR